MTTTETTSQVLSDSDIHLGEIVLNASCEIIPDEEINALTTQEVEKLFKDLRVASGDAMSSLSIEISPYRYNHNPAILELINVTRVSIVNLATNIALVASILSERPHVNTIVIA